MKRPARKASADGALSLRSSRPSVQSESASEIRVHSRDSRAEKFVSSYSELGEIFGLHRASFPRLLKRSRADGLDCPVPKDNGRHDVAAWRRFFEEHPEIRRRAAEGTLVALDEAIKEEKLRDWQRHNDVEDGKYLLKEDVDAWLVERIQLLRDRIASRWKNELAPKLAGKTAAEILARMEPEIAALCDILRELNSR